MEGSGGKNYLALPMAAINFHGEVEESVNTDIGAVPHPDAAVASGAESFQNDVGRLTGLMPSGGGTASLPLFKRKRKSKFTAFATA